MTRVDWEDSNAVGPIKVHRHACLDANRNVGRLIRAGRQSIKDCMENAAEGTKAFNDPERSGSGAV
jgi:hypothetical protein